MNNEIVKRIISSIILVPVTLFFIVKGTFFFNFFILICFIIIGSEWHMMTKKIKLESLNELGSATFVSDLMAIKHENSVPRIYRT